MKYQHPGELIKAAMKAKGLTQLTFANSIQMAPSQVSETLSGLRSITPEFCLALEHSGIGDAEIWLFLAARFDLQILRNKK